MNNNDTICALATAPGGAIAIIRVSGNNSISIVSGIFNKPLLDAKANTVHYGEIREDKQTIDEVLVTVFRDPHSYTGEDSIEISCHGSRYIIQQILDLLVKHGCRMAEPGEYTMHAFMNGKMDLSQAEAVADLIASNNKATHQLALSQLRGGFSSELARLREQLLHLTALLELELDFSDHEDLEFADRSELLTLTQTIDNHIQRLADSFEKGQALKQGIPVAIVGKTNVGKSTLLNRLLNDDRAIVSEVHGTTRDTIEDVIDIHGVNFRIIDTAGLRQTTDTVENIGIERTYAAIDKAHIIVWLTDQEPTSAEVSDMQQRANGRPILRVQNKMDVNSTPHKDANICISAKTGENISALLSAIYDAANLPDFGENNVIVSSARHYQILLQAHQHVTLVLHGLQSGISGDLIAEDLNTVLDDLAQITGQDRITPQETLNQIFSSFCVGK